MTQGMEQYQPRMDRVARHISDSLEEGRTPSVEELAQVAAFSPFHFHRVYRILTGETVAQSLQRLKVAHALERVSAGESVTIAAHASGYGSSQNLAKAVKQCAGASVSKLRESGRLGEAANELGMPEAGGSPMTFDLIDHSPVRIVCRLVTGPYAQLNLAYRSLFAQVSAASGAEAVIGVYGIPVDDPREVPETEHRFICALAIDGEPTGLDDDIEIREIGDGHWARSRHSGPYSEIPAALDRLYAGLLEAGYRLDDRETFIHYIDQPGASDGPDDPHISDIHVPVGA